MNTEMENNSANAILKSGMANAGPFSPIGEGAGINVADGAPYVVIPDGYTVHNLEHLLPTPTRARAAVVVADSDSFIGYVNKHGMRTASTIYADIDSEESRLKLTAVLNDHTSTEADWRDHTCALTPKQSVEWRRWLGKNKQAMNQIEFATWLEDNLSDVASV
jgi:uncharacterized protein YfdQ (DUF2303 family)